MNESCESCKFWSATYSRVPSEDENHWDCRRYPPVLAREFELEETLCWQHPLTMFDDWCGEYRRRPVGTGRIMPR
jgi:hypothetical protein